MAKKRKRKSSLLPVIVTLVVVAALGFGALKFFSVRLFGTYKYEATGSILGVTINAGSGTYTFSGINKVEYEGTIAIVGTVQKTGTYKINGDNTITLTFPEEVKKDDGTTEVVQRSDSYEFYKGDNTIKIGGTEYKKQK